MRKCNLCIERVQHGLEPACVRVCPTRALGFGPQDTLALAKAEKASLSILHAFSAAPPGGKDNPHLSSFFSFRYGAFRGKCEPESG